MERKFTSIIISAALILFFLTPGCIEDYLDKAPESGLNKEEVFSKKGKFQELFRSCIQRRQERCVWHNRRLEYQVCFSFENEPYE